jgi:Tol biopolymer transport system component
MKDGKADGEPFLLKGGLGKRFFPHRIADDGSLIYSQHMTTRNVKIATIDFKSGKVISEPKVFAKSIKGNNFLPSWSPDGKFLAYASWREEADWRSKMLFAICDLETGEETELQTNLIMANYLSELRFRWSPNGKSLLILGGDPRRVVTGFYLFDIKTGERTPLLEEEYEGGDVVVGTAAELAPDGKTLYYLKHLNLDSDKRRLMKYVISSNTKTILHEDEKGIRFSALSPDGNFLAFGFTVEKRNELWKIPTDGGEAHLIGSLDEGESIKYPEWTPDSRHIIAYAWNSKDLYSFPIEGGKPTNLDLTLEDGRYLSIHPDGKRIAFTHEPRAGGDIYIMENFIPESKNKR